MKQQRLIFTVLAALLGMGGAALAADPHASHGAPATATTATIPATGTVKSVDAAAGKLVIAHEPIPALNWPRMVMDFQLADKTLAGKVKAGDKVKFDLKEGDQGAYLVIAIEPVR